MAKRYFFHLKNSFFLTNFSVKLDYVTDHLQLFSSKNSGKIMLACNRFLRLISLDGGYIFVKLVL